MQIKLANCSLDDFDLIIDLIIYQDIYDIKTGDTEWIVDVLKRGAEPYSKMSLLELVKELNERLDQMSDILDYLNTYEIREVKQKETEIIEKIRREHPEWLREVRED